MGWKDSDREEKAVKDVKDRSSLPDIVRKKFPAGKSTVRIVSEPKFALVHWMTTVSREVVCPKTTDEFTNCLVCETGENSRIRYYTNILDREDGVVKLWSFPRQVKEYISALDDAFGDPTLYDVVVTRIGTKLDTSWIVTPANKGKETPLTDAEKELVKNAIDLDRLYKVTPTDKVKSYLSGKLPEKNSGNEKVSTIKAVHEEKTSSAPKDPSEVPNDLTDPLEDDRPF